MSFDPSSRSRLTSCDLGRFPSESLFDRVGRTVCGVGRLPRKELFESWEVARRIRRRLRGRRVVDLACGHGLVAHLMLLLDDSSPCALAVDTRIPQSAEPLAAALADAWPRLAGRVELLRVPMADVELGPQDLVVSTHACGALTDQVLACAVAASAPVAVLPCCHDAATLDSGGLDGWMPAAVAIDATRAARLRAHGYRVHTQRIPERITPENRLLIGEPPEPA